MDYDFRWNTSINQKIRENLETRIREDLNARSPFIACHRGTLFVMLSSSDPLEEFVVGGIKCNCGKSLGTLKGSISGSEIIYSRVD